MTIESSQSVLSIVFAGNESKSCLHDLDECREGQHPLSAEVLTAAESLQGEM